MLFKLELRSFDSVSDLKLKDMNLVETYNKWTNLLQNMAKNKCHGCTKLEEHIKLAREIRKHKEEVNALKFQMSDEALQQMPDFQGRVCLNGACLSWLFLLCASWHSVINVNV